MASLSYEAKNNRWRIQFVAPTGGRKTVSLKATRGRDKGQSKAAVFKNHIEDLVTAVKSGTSIPPAIVSWANGLPIETHDALAAAGLLDKRTDPELSKLGPFLKKWLADREGTKYSTVLTWKNVERNLRDYFGADQMLRHITEDDAENFQRWLQNSEKLSPATVRKRVSIAKQMFKSAIKARLINQNPFHELKTGSLANKKRQHFVTHDEARRVLDACSNADWRALVALGRYGALRIPSEIRGMVWDDINWAEGCLHVHATKTEHHADEGDRVIPLFPELRKYLWELHEAAEDGQTYVFPNIRHTTNVLPTLHRIIKRAGLKAWPKAWQNMRATRATELENEFGAHKATEWCGHTEKIAEAHYWMTTADDVAKASEVVTDPKLLQSGAHLVQKREEEGGTGQPAVSRNPDFSAAFASLRASSRHPSRARGT
ncbi:MAG: hypothetical protein Fues2KO_11050 [Fuerstiella sp.]